MPNISFDIFYSEDVLNITATRGTGAPKVKPAWKVRSAPKLPKLEAPDRKTQAFGPASQNQPSTKAIEPSTSAASSAAGGQQKKIPKLGPKKQAGSNKSN